MLVSESTPAVLLSNEERQELQALTRSSLVSSGALRGAHVILLAADGERIKSIARLVGVQRKVVKAWIDRYRRHGLSALKELERPDRGHVPLGGLRGLAARALPSAPALGRIVPCG